MLDFLFHPKSIAAIGASRTPGQVGHEVLSNLVTGGFGGTIVPVNSSAQEILGLKCYNDIDSYGRPVDLAIIALPAASVVEAVRDSIRGGSKAIVVLTAGFAETGSRGILLQSEVARLCLEARVRLLGPNSLGLINTSHRLNASFARYMPTAGCKSMVSQSGALCKAVLGWAHANGIGLAKVVSIGNKADLKETDFLKILAVDEQTRVVIGYLENIDCGDEFIRAAREVTSRKPFILMRAGATRMGMRVACAHTGNPAGADTAYAAAFQRAGIIRADNLDALFDHASAFARQPLPRGNRIALITNADGPAVVATDAVERTGMRLAKLAGQAVERLRNELPCAAGTNNPIDVLGDATPSRYAAAVHAAQHDDCVDASVVILTPHAMAQPLETVSAIASQTTGEKPLAPVFLGAPNGERWGGQNLPIYSSPERAVAALHAMHKYHLWRH